MRAVRVLFVDDCEDDVFIATHYLKKAGWSVTAHTVDTATALEHAIVDFRPDLILSDMSIPGFSGLEALAVIKRVNTQVPFLFLCGSPCRYAEQAASSGLAVLDKDDPDTFVDRIGELLLKSRI